MLFNHRLQVAKSDGAIERQVLPISGRRLHLALQQVTSRLASPVATPLPGCTFFDIAAVPRRLSLLRVCVVLCRREMVTALEVLPSITRTLCTD